MDTLHKMIKNYDNKNFVGALYYELGTIEFKTKLR